MVVRQGGQDRSELENVNGLDALRSVRLLYGPLVSMISMTARHQGCARSTRNP